ncbi:40S ribosomal protein S12, mitochondrial [Ceratina calcarata]|uniref:Small ribosomal subunit protein uS12m n=1 Tax=Ceratina calcarata TaxID=156304 RepID=A0AAJ7IWZ6_9HYME|nr:40S ribosomal protein S12, mitochondrial [Ceratina calcarata]
MNFLTRNVINVAKVCLKNSLEVGKPQLNRLCVNPISTQATSLIQAGKLLNSTSTNSCIGNLIQGFQQIRLKSTLCKLHFKGDYRKKRKKKKNPFDGKPFAKGIVIKTLIKKPKKPNSANRKCVLLRLSSGKEMIAYVPGEGHNLQEHNVVLCRVRKVKDTPGVRIRCIRGKYDLPHVVKKKT